MNPTHPTLDRPLVKPSEVNESLFALLFAETVRYINFHESVRDVEDFQNKLSSLGFEVGWRTLELVASREKIEKREIRIIQALQHVTGACWISLFGKQTDSLERSTESDTFLITETDPLPCKYTSTLSGPNLASFNAGIIHGLLVAQGLDCTVKVHYVADRPGAKFVYVVKFDPAVIQREARTSRSSS